jgi:hypothetical protein
MAVISFICKVILTFCFGLICITSIQFFISSFFLDKIEWHDVMVNVGRMICIAIGLIALIPIFFFWL